MGDSILHSYKVPEPQTTVYRVHVIIHSAAVLAVLYYRFSHLILHPHVSPLLWSLVTLAEFFFSLIWFFQQPFKWRPTIREVHPENIRLREEDFPAVDVFICTADPTKEPTVDVMNTVISALALDYHRQKLSVYLSDDGGVPLTLHALREAFVFAKTWVPFCKKYGIITICPKAYFSKMADDERLLRSSDHEFKDDENLIKSQYEIFTENVEKFREEGNIRATVVSDRPPCIEVIHDGNDDETKLPMLVYVSRERRPMHPHRYKGGNLNALLRISGVMSNAPFICILDCDMFCNEPASAKQAMCFHLEPKISQSLAFVQYPQIFHNLGKDDIYDAQGRATYKTQWTGMDGLRGPVLSGTGYYMKRKALFGTPPKTVSYDSLYSNDGKETSRDRTISSAVIEEAKKVATCTYEQNSNWGKEVGFSYESLLESSFTGYLLHCRGWRSVYCYPNRPAFLGCAPADLKDASSMLLKWISGLLQVGLSKYNPITYGMSKMPISQSLCYCYFMYLIFYTFSVGLYGIVPQLGFYDGVPLYPKVSSPWFWLFALIYASSLFEQLYENLLSGGTIKMWWNEYRIWMIQSITGVLFGGIDAFSKILGIKKASLRLSNKAIDEEKLKSLDKGKFDFQGAGKFLVPLATYVILNAVCFVVGVKRMIVEMNFDEMFGQFLLSSLILFTSYSIIEGLVSMKR